METISETINTMRGHKLSMISTADWIRKMADQIEFRASNIPEIDDVEHAQKVCAMAKMVADAYQKVEDAAMYGII